MNEGRIKEEEKLKDDEIKEILKYSFIENLTEILFRYILYNRLKKFNSNKLAILITSIIFAIIHIELQKIFFALILGLILNTAYESHKNILVPVIIHISANLIALLLTEFNISILLLSIILFIVNLKVIFNRREYF